MTDTISFKDYIKEFNYRMEKYIPQKPWTPADEALYKPDNLFEVTPKEAEKMRFKAIKYAFNHHYENNSLYKNFCRDSNISPDDIKTGDDLTKIPLIPDKFFKDYPSGKDFASWLNGLFTGDMPEVAINKKNPSYDDVINAFNEKGLEISYSSGTSGRHTFIPRDRKTYYASEYALAKTVITMIYPFWEYEMDGYLMMPDPHKTNVYAGKVCAMYFDAIDSVRVAIDRDIPADMIKEAMGTGIKSSILKFALNRGSKKMVDKMVKWLREVDKKGKKMSMIGLPFILHFVMNRLEEEGESFDFGENGGVVTGGGWKIYENERMPVEKFRKRVNDVLGIPEENCLDAYGMVEGNVWMVQCPEGHYLHIPHSYFQPLILNDEYEPVGYGEWGRFAFLDPMASSYPGFIMSGDKVRMLEHCPVCDRPGPVMEPEVKRVHGEEMRGCAEEMRHVLSMDLGG